MPAPVVEFGQLIFDALYQVQTNLVRGPLFKACLVFEKAGDVGENVNETVLVAFVLFAAYRPGLIDPVGMFEETAAFRDEADGNLGYTNQSAEAGSTILELERRLTSVARQDSKADLNGSTAKRAGPHICTSFSRP